MRADDQVRYWDTLAEVGADRAVIDPNDRKGLKNEYVIGLRNRTIMQELAHMRQPATVLDFGCGSGNLSNYLVKAGFGVVGVDISPRLLEHAAKRETAGECSLVRYDGYRLPFKDGEFDSVVTYVVLNHIINDVHLAGILDEIYRVLRMGGRLVAVEQITRGRRVNRDGTKVQRPLNDFVALFRSAGFTLCKSTAIRFGHFPMTYLIRQGLVPRKYFVHIASLERFVGRFMRGPVFDYADVAFVVRKS